MKISEHLELSELITSDSAKRNGISNMPTDQHLASLKVLADKVFEPIRNHFAIPIFISSGYRSEELNKKIGGSKTSQHCKGQAIDIDMDGSNSEVSNNDIFHWAKANLKFTQLIAEFPDSYGNLGWVHIGYDAQNLKNEIIIAVSKNKYVPYKGNEKLVK
jgi:hypothetical protein